MATTSVSIFHRLKDIACNRYIMKPVYYAKNSNCMLIPTNTITGIGAIWKYDLDKQIIIEKYEYPPEVYANDPQIFIDIDNDIVYTMNDYHILMSFDLKTKTWDTSICNDDIDCANITLIPSPINQIHLTMNNTHYKLNKQNKCLIQLQQNIGALRDQQNNELYNDAKFIYNSLTKQLFMFQRNCRDVLCCQIDVKHQKSFNWKKLEIQLPLAAPNGNFEVILAWDRIIFWFYMNEIWCLDLSYSTEWHPVSHSVAKLLNGRDNSFVVKDKENNIHLISRNNNMMTYKHYKAILFDLLPTKIIELNKNEFDPLIIGFIKECEQKDQCPFVPIYLEKLVLEFYPIFL